MKAPPSNRGMTLLEMLLAMAIVGVVLIIIAYAINMMQNTWVRVRSKADGYRNTRLALDTVARRISQATLGTRWTVDESQTENFKYVTDSDLHFVCGPASDLLNDKAHTVGHAIFFQAPFGLDNPPGTGNSHIDKQKLNATLNAWGYFVEYGSDASERPPFMVGNTDRFPERHRFRLMEFRQPAGELSLFNLQGGNPPELKLGKASSIDQLYSWFNQPVAAGRTYQQRHVTVVAENILALLITPLDPKLREANSDLANSAPYQIVPQRVWDSRGFQIGGGGTLAADDPQRHRMPPAVQLTAIALSEDAWTSYPENAGLDYVCEQLRSFVEDRFHQGQTLARDIAETAQMLDEKRPRIPYRIVTILVPLSGQ
ncbi:MAG: Verru Chthon cassette protein [Verrucomicrobiaceae bacterium]|nr:Verru Chthon cassette protein [Verrucomicrobiaceae bacterium]